MAVKKKSAKKSDQKSKNTKGIVVVYKKTNKGISPAAAEQKASQHSITEEYAKFRINNIAVLAGLPEFDQAVYEHFRPALFSASQSDKTTFTVPDNKSLVTGYFKYLVAEKNGGTPFQAVKSFEKFVSDKTIFTLDPKQITAPDRFNIGAIIVAVPGNIQHMYETYISDKNLYDNPPPIDIFMMAHTPKAYKHIVDGVVNDYSCLDPMNVVEKWGFMNDFCIASAIEALSNIDAAGEENNVDILSQLKKAEYYIRYRINYIEKEISELPADIDPPVTK